MNGAWYPWAEAVNGNTPGSYVEAWRRVHTLFREEGAVNVSWIWSPLVRSLGSLPLSNFYPGDDYVDWVGLDGYNGGTALEWGGWISFEKLFGASLSELQTFTKKPIAICEMGSAEQGGDKGEWIRQFFDALKRHPEIESFTWFNFNKGTDWRITSSPSAARSFAEGIGGPR